MVEKLDDMIRSIDFQLIRVARGCEENRQPRAKDLPGISCPGPVMDYQSVIVKRHLQPSSTKRNAESRYWRQFKHPVFVKEYAPVTSVHFSPSRPHRYAVTAATRVQIYAPRTQKITKTISRFKDVARSGSIRGDGKLVIAGDDTGLVQVNLNLVSEVLHLIVYFRYSILILEPFSGHWTPTSSLSMSPNFHLWCRPRPFRVLTIPRSNFGMYLHKL